MSKHLERLNNIYWSFSKKYYNTVMSLRLKCNIWLGYTQKIYYLMRS